MPGQTVQINVRSQTNRKVRRETRNGREVLVVTSATLPDNVIMNRVFYPAEEIERSFGQLEGSPAPFGHPRTGNRHVSAYSPEGINVGWVGAHNENARRIDGRVWLDKVIDIEVASRTENGRKLIAAIERGEPIPTSTGLTARLKPAASPEFDAVASDIVFDHDAILLEEQAAVSPDQGVGMMVNDKTTPDEKTPVINSSLLELAEEDVDHAGARLIEAMQRRNSASVWQRVKNKLMDSMNNSEPKESKEDVMSVSKEEFDALQNRVTELTNKLDNLDVTTQVTNALQPIQEQLTAMSAEKQERETAEREELSTTLVNAQVIDADTAKELPLKALRSMSAKAKPGHAAALNSAFPPKQGNDDLSSKFKLPEAN